MNLFWTLLLCALGFQSTVQLLNKTVIPLHYKLELYANLGDQLDKFEFSGFVAIRIKCLEKTNTITLHSENLRVGVAHVTHKINQLKNMNGTIVLDHKEDLLTLHLPSDLEKNNIYIVDMFFGGDFEEVLNEGFFLSSSKNPSTDETVYNATTYLQDGKARKVFPCFDEPELKATFKIMIGHVKKYKAISNMPEDHTEPIPKLGKDWIWTYFKKTGPLSPDQVTFAVFEPPKPQSTNTSRPPPTITEPKPQSTNTSRPPPTITKPKSSLLSLGRGIRKRVRGGLKELLD